ncbi:MAG: PLDc N-terminal domain-containing protein [Acidimicrobiia bacterium]|nr:PLDc N-terminal domain-containing protein [Acidimicrobiia bacterium]
MPVLDVLFSMLIFFLFIAWIWVLISVISDIFRSDMSGWSKALWVLFVIILPWLGVLIYLIVNGDDMADRSAKDAIAMEEAQRAYIKSAAGTLSPSDELAKLAALKEAGDITEDEYQKLRAQVIG